MSTTSTITSRACAPLVTTGLPTASIAGGPVCWLEESRRSGLELPALLGVGSVMSGVNEARTDSGVGGLSAIQRRASFLSVLIGLAAMFALGGALAHAGASQAVISVFEASAPVMVAGLYYLSTSIVQLNWPLACLGVWLLAVVAAGGYAGPAGVWGVNALAAGLAYLLM